MAGELDQIEIALNPSVQLALAAILFLMVLAVALSLKPADFAFLKSRPLRPFVGFAAQIIGLPLLTLALLPVLAPSPSIALGMIVVACCPGGSVSNLLTLIARGDAALSVSLTAISSALAPLLTPAAIIFWSGLYPPTRELVDALNINAASFIIQTTLLLGVPLALGLGLSALRPQTAEFLRRPVVFAATLGLATLVVVGVALNFDIALRYGALIIPIVAAHNAAGFALGFLIALIARFPDAQRRTLAFEVGIQNSGLGLVILLSQFHGLGGAAAITATWGVWHLIAGAALAMSWRRFGR